MKELSCEILAFDSDQEGLKWRLVTSEKQQICESSERSEHLCSNLSDDSLLITVSMSFKAQGEPVLESF